MTTDPSLEKELPFFVERIKEIFSQEELRYFLANARNLGALSHILSDEEHENWSAEGVIEDGPAVWAENALLIEQVKSLLLE